jgi:hypothetical protein
VRQQQVDRRGLELQESLVRGDRVVTHVDGTQDAAVDLAEFGCTEPEETIGDRGEAVAAGGIAAVASIGCLIAIQADPDTDSEVFEDLQHAALEKRAVGLDRYGHPGRDGPV